MPKPKTQTHNPLLEMDPKALLQLREHFSDIYHRAGACIVTLPALITESATPEQAAEDIQRFFHSFKRLALDYPSIVELGSPPQNVPPPS